jgi:hypothetical protein
MLLNIGKGLEIVVVLAFSICMDGCSSNPDQFCFSHTLPTTPLPPHHIQKYEVYYKENIQIKNK